MAIIFDAIILVAFKAVPAPIKVTVDYLRIRSEATSDRLVAGDVSSLSAAPRTLL